MELVKKIEVENHYSGNGWNFEKTEKYIFRSGSYQLEAGYFEHYLNEQYVKSVIELPVSYGCPARCKFCATSAIEKFVKLEPEQMEQLLEYIWAEKSLLEKKYVLLSLTGTGDLYFNFSNVISFLSKLTKYKNLHVTVSSCLWDAVHLQEMERLSKQISIRNVQITCVGTVEEKLKNLIPIYQQRNTNLDEVIRFIQTSGKSYYRFNYIMVCDENDSLEHAKSFLNKLAVVKDKIVVRLAKLNETRASERNRLVPSNFEKMYQFSDVLTKGGVKNYLFYAHKNDNMNCGQLITENSQMNKREDRGME